MANPVAKLLLQVIGDSTSGVAALKKTAAAGKEAEGAATKTGGAWSKVGKVAAAVGGAFAAAKVVEFAKESVSAASDLNESWSKVGVVFGSSASMVQQWSKTSATSMGLSQQAALEAAGTYGNLAVALGLTPKKAAEMSTSLVGLAGDLASFNNVPVGDALKALQSGLTGEVEPLRRFGVSLSAARVEAEAMRLGLAKAPVDMAKVGVATGRLELAQKSAAAAIKRYGANSDQAKRATLAVQSAQQGVSKAMGGAKVNLTAAAKAQATYSLIMKDTATAQGDFARTSDGMANQQRIAAAQFEDMKATLGQALLPILQTLVQFLNASVIPVLQQVSKFVKDNSTAVQVFAGVILAVVIVTKTWQGVQLAAAAATKAWTLAQRLLNLAFFQNPIGLIILAVVALIAVIVLIATKTTWFQTIWKGMTAGISAAWRASSSAIIAAWNAVWGFLAGVFGWIARNWPLLLAILTGPFGVAVLVIIRNWSTITGFFAGIVATIGRVMSGVIGAITSPFITAFNIVRGIVDAAIGGVRAAVGGMASFVGGALNGAKSAYNTFARIWNAVQVGVPDVKVLGKTVVPGFTLGFPDLPIMRFAKGAYVKAPTLAMFGEAGDEWALPDRKLRQLIRSEAGGAVNITINVPPTANPVETGRAVANALRSYFGAGGRLQVPA
jgi:hypothetical protein